MLYRKQISKLSIVSVAFLILGFLALPVCEISRRVMERRDLDYTRMTGNLFSLVPWGIAFLLALLAATSILAEQKKGKNSRLPWTCCLVSLLLIVGYSVPFPEYLGTMVDYRGKTFEGDSSELKDTVIVPALKSPISKGKNVIWCSSFQLAWNKLKDDVIKEPILLSENQELADLLNQAKQSREDVSENDYYARAGFVQDNIIETIQAEMSQKFPDEPMLSFEGVTDDAIISYSFLTTNVKFKKPYFENNEEFFFTDDRGNITAITSFGIRKEDEYKYNTLRDQLEILFYDTNEKEELTECALDLCDNSSPSQIVIAMVKPKASLSETLLYVQEKIEKHPRKGYLNEFQPNEVLLVPNLFWKIKHPFSELEGRKLQNSGYESMPIEKAEQVIQFRLDRSGAETKSEFRLRLKSQKPRYFVFDRPFLIYMKKRGAEHPFFVMWVDNAELLEKWGNTTPALRRKINEEN